MEENNWTIEDPMVPKPTFRTGWKIAWGDDGYCLIKLSVPEGCILSDPEMRNELDIENDALSAGTRLIKVMREYVNLPPKKIKTIEDAFLIPLNNMDVRLRRCKCRASRAKVEKIISIRSLEEKDMAISRHDSDFVYRKDAVVHYRKECSNINIQDVNTADELIKHSIPEKVGVTSPTYLEALVDKYTICGPGIHYFNSWLLAMYYLIVMYCDMQVDEFVNRVTKLDEMIQRGDI